MRVTILVFCLNFCFFTPVKAQESILYLYEYSIYENFQDPKKYYKEHHIKAQKAIVIDALDNDTLFVNQTSYNLLGYKKEESVYKKGTLVSQFQNTFDSNNHLNKIEHNLYDRPLGLSSWKYNYDAEGKLKKVSLCDSNKVKHYTISYKYDVQQRCIETQSVANKKNQLTYIRKHIYKKDGLLEVIKTTYFPKSLPHKRKSYKTYDTNGNLIKQFARKNGKERVSHRNVYNDKNQLIEQWIPKGPATTKYKATKFTLVYDDQGLLIRRLAYEKEELKQIVTYEYTFFE